MATGNYVLLERITVGAAGASSVTFSNIPQTGYTDLKIVLSARTNAARTDDYALINFNGVSTNLTCKILYGAGSSNGSVSASNINCIIGAASATANTFGNTEFYIPNYTSSNYKSVCADGVQENNATSSVQNLTTGLWSSTSAITSVTFSATYGSFVQYSTFSLYALAAVGVTPTKDPKALGGDIIQTDGTYWYHAFIGSGSFTPKTGTSLSCDVLVVAGGGGAGEGGGGAGGIFSATGQSLNSGTAYTATIGAGGTGGAQTTAGTSGGNSSFGSISGTIYGGGGGGDWQSAGTGTNNAGLSGGSGGGAGTADSGLGGNVGTGTSGQGNNGGTAVVGAGTNAGGGGGGATALGGNATSTASGTGGNGGTGIYNALTDGGGAILNLGQLSGGHYYFAGGGGGGNSVSSTASASSGGLGGGGAGYKSGGTAGTVNTGGGGGGGGYNGSFTSGGNGGSGVVIVRYLV